MSLVEELKRRNVFRVATAYIIIAWLILQVGDTLAPALRLPDVVNTILAYFLILGFPLVIFFAWAYELTPEGLRREREVDRSRSITTTTGRRLDMLNLGLLVLAIGFIVVDRFGFGGDASAPTSTAAPPVATNIDHKSIAVLPFVNMSSDPEQTYFSDGISEELLNVLAGVDGLRVVSRTSSFAFRGSDSSMAEVAAALNVKHVLEGSVRKSGDTVRVTAQLIDVETDSHLWSDSYDRQLSDILVIQDEIARHIVDALEVTLLARDSPTDPDSADEMPSLEAYEIYLQGRFNWHQRTEATNLQAIALLEQATEIAPDFARAWATLAGAHVTLPAYSAVDETVHNAAAVAAAEKALSLDDTLADAHAVLGDIARVERRWADAEEHYLRALQHEPSNSTATIWYGEHLFMAGRLRDSLRQIQLAYEMDPMHPAVHKDLAAIYYNLGETEEALRYAESAWALRHFRGLIVLTLLHVDSGQFDEALESAERLDQSRATPNLAGWVTAMRDAGTRDAYLDFLEDNEDSIRMHMLLPAYVRLGDIDAAYRLVEARPGPGRFGYLWSVWRPGLEAFRSDPRFASLADEIGLLEYWQSHGWPDLCRPDGDSVACD